MRVILKAGLLAISVETDEEQEAFAAWRESARDHVFHFDGGSVRGGAFQDLGPRPDACREPINIVSDMRDVRWRPIGNMAHTPFVLRGRAYASIEGFWQGLKFESDVDRERVAALWDKAAKAAAYDRPTAGHFVYEGATIVAGSAEHRSLMLEACRAKFSQNIEAREALLSTGDRPLTHRVRRDSTTIPGAIMAEFWMRIRRSLRKAAAEQAEVRG